MTDTTQALTAAEKLAQLEQAAEDGASVTAAQLAEAKAAVELEQHRSRGEMKRAEKARLKAQAEAREKAKKDAVGKLHGYPEKVYEAYDAAVAAIDALAREIEAHNDKIRDVGDTYSSQGVFVRSSWVLREEFPAHYDAAFTATASQTGAYSQVKIDGVAYSPTSVAQWVVAAVLAATADHSMSIDYKQNVRDAIRYAGTPALLASRAK